MSTYMGVTNFQKTVRFFGPPCSFQLKLDYLGKSKVQICLKNYHRYTTKIVPYVIKMKHYMSWLKDYLYCHTSCSCVYNFSVHVIKDDLATCQLYCQLCCG